jgi:hypothetical protein
MNRAGGENGEALGQVRQATVDALCEHFANDNLPVEEFERRVEVAHRAASSQELAALLTDLPGGGLPAPRAAGAATPTAPASRPGMRPRPPRHEKEQGFALAVMGGATRKGHWTPARRTFAVALMGGVELDFREVDLPPGVTEVHGFSLMGGIDVIVPPGVNVESHGMGIMGGFEDVGGGEYYPNAPTLRIAGLAVMGAVDITVRYPGESAREARRRRKEEARKTRKRLRDSWE